MPELPEVETVRISLHDQLLGRHISGVHVHEFTGVIGSDDPSTFATRITNRLVTNTRRRGKYILIDLDDDSLLVVHLRMTGNLVLVSRQEPRLRFEHLAIVLDDGMSLRFSDQRKFGRVIHLLPQEANSIDEKVGPEPLAPQFTAEAFGKILLRRSGPIKSILLNQQVIAGIGNIYADEALFQAKIHPLTPANRLNSDQIRILHRSIRGVLREGLLNRGTSISHFRDGAGQEGANQYNLKVYGKGRSGEPCPRCGTPLSFIVIGGRSSHYCSNCQALPT